MKTLASIALALTVCSLSVFADGWNPVPMVIDVQDIVSYQFDGSGVDIPFSLTGKPAKIWLVIESRLADEEKPVAVQNGFMGWHFVNGIDTTIYVSPARTYETGSNIFPWDGHGNERGDGDQKDKISDSGPVALDYCTYYLWGYDHESDRELACDFLPIGNYWEGQYQRFYPYDDTGALYDTPMLMGQLPFFSAYIISANYDSLIGRGDLFKWKMGNDPLDTSLLETSHVTGFKPNEVYEHPDSNRSYMVGYGAGIFDPRDHDTFYFTKNRWWKQDQTVVKYTFVPDGEAVQDTSWGDYSHISWFHTGNKTDYSMKSVLHHLGDNTLVMVDGSLNGIDYQHDKLHAFNIGDPTEEYFNTQLDEFYMPNQPVHAGSGISRTSSEINRLFPAKREGTFFITGDYTCLQECIDVSRLIGASGDLDPYTPDGSGYVVWANSNGDFFFDMSAYPDPDWPEGIWACIVSDPRNSHNPREELQPADMHGFLISYAEYYQNQEFGLYAPDGSGIGFGQFADLLSQAGGSSNMKYGGGEMMDYGGQYDGMYMLPAFSDGYGPFTINYMKTCWIAFDSDMGIISQSVSVEDDTPEPFTIAQNSPNPFNPTTSIAFTLAEAGQVSVEVHNVAGQKVDTLVDGFMAAGSHSVVWDADGFAAGVYFYTVRSGVLSKTVKMTLLK